MLSVIAGGIVVDNPGSPPEPREGMMWDSWLHEYTEWLERLRIWTEEQVRKAQHDH